jgi:hypothetical protein
LRQYKVVLAQKGADYKLKLKRSDGSMATYIIIYQDQEITSDSLTIKQIASTFQAL